MLIRSKDFLQWRCGGKLTSYSFGYTGAVTTLIFFAQKWGFLGFLGNCLNRTNCFETLKRAMLTPKKWKRINELPKTIAQSHSIYTLIFFFFLNETHCTGKHSTLSPKWNCSLKLYKNIALLTANRELSNSKLYSENGVNFFLISYSLKVVWLLHLV